MTSPATNPGTVASGAVPLLDYRCTACGRDFAASSAYVRHGLSHLIDPAGRSPRVCFRGRMEPVGPVVVDIARDDRAGVTLPTAVEPVGRDQLVPGGAGQGDQVVERRHGDSIAIDRANVTSNRDVDGSPAFAHEAP